MRFARPLCTAAALIALGACMPRPAPPAPAPVPPAPAPTPPPAPIPPPVDWQDAPLSQGDWLYGPGQRAAFGAGSPLFTVECTPRRQIALVRSGAAAGPTLSVRTTFGERSVAAALAPGDPLLDEIAFSRGRFLVRVGGQPDLILPTWPELARVVEDCRQ